MARDSFPALSGGQGSLTPPLHWVKPPQQARSQKTLERLLDAAEELIAERGVASVTVSEVVRRAGSSVGAFYARFPDKDALLATLHERSCAEALATAELALDPKRWEAVDLASAVHEIVKFAGALYKERRGIAIAFVELTASDTSFADRRAALETETGLRLLEFLRARESEVAHTDLNVAAQVAIRMILSTLECGAMIFRGEGSDASGLSDDRIAMELTRAVLGYLGAPVSSGRRLS
jgi:AcrR family transcriptional regulator